MIKFLKNECSLYVINLDKDVDRMKFIDSQLKKYDIPYTRVSGSYRPHRPVLGCTESHIKAINQSLSNDKHAVIIEDDAFFTEEFDKHSIEYEDALKKLKWDMVFLYYSGYRPKEGIVRENDNNLWLRGNTFGAHFFIINTYFKKRVLDNITKKNKPVDDMYAGMVKTCNMFVTKSNLVAQNCSFMSNIINKFRKDGKHNGVFKNIDNKSFDHKIKGVN
jgi:GR25 family glycosyltransferase involved in LPS biosynthesis